MKFGVIVFPGSNCDLDSYHLVGDILNEPVDYIRYNADSVEDYDIIILPGGFTYGDYLRSGAIAARTPVMKAVHAFAEKGGLILGICNGFQVLTEAGLLPGALYRNNNLQFRCRQVYVRVENTNLPFTNKAVPGDLLQMPVAHGDGNYYLSSKKLQELKYSKQIIFRYADSKGELTEDANPNGSVDNICGVSNPAGNVVGLMPHPERAGEKVLGSEDGLVIFKSLLEYFKNREVRGGTWA